MVTKIAVIWGLHEEDPPFHTEHSFWEATIKDRPDLQMTRFTWHNWTTMPKDFDLYFFLDFHPTLYQLDTLDYHPRALYWWDCFHWTFCYPAQISEYFDKSYFAEYLTATTLQSQGYNASWLPSGFYPGVYHPLPDAVKIHDYAFIGQLNNVVIRKGDTRYSFMSKLNGTQQLRGFIGYNSYGHQANKILNEAQVLFDRTIFNNVGTRFFLNIGSGGFCLMNRVKGYNGIDTLATEGVHYISYDDSFQDFEYKLRYYLKHSQEREQIAKQGFEYFLVNHTYNHRLNRILRDFHLA